MTNLESLSEKKLSFKDAVNAAVASSATNRAAATPTSSRKTIPSIPDPLKSNDTYVEPTMLNMFRATPIADTASVQRPHISCKTRMYMKDKDYLQVIDSFVKPLKTKLELLDYTKLNELSEEVFQRNDKIETFITDLMERLEYFEASDVLTKHIILGPKSSYSSNDSGRFDPHTNTGKVIDLSKEWDRIGNDKEYPLMAIAEANDWKHRYTKKEYDILLQDGQLLHTLLLNSMSQDLKDAVLGDLRRNFTTAQRSGSLTFGVMLQHVINLSESAIDSLKDCLKGQNLSNIPGQNVTLLTRRLHYGLDRLKHNNAFPRNVQKLVFDVMSTSSVPEFDQWVTVYKNMIALRPKSEQPDYVDLLNHMDEKYGDLCQSGDWCGLHQEDTGGSAFQYRSGNDRKHHDNPSKQGDSGGNQQKKQQSIWRPPEKDEAIGDDRFARVIRKKFMGYCKHCKGKRSGKKGTWTTTHFSPDCTSAEGSGRSSLLMQLNSNDGSNPRANLADTGTSGGSSSDGGTEKKLSFKEQLLAGLGSDDE